MTSTVIGIIIVIIIYVIVLFTLRRVESNLLSGFWIASADFCVKAQLSLLMIQIGEPTWNGRPGYVLMVREDNNILISSPVDLSFSSMYSIKPWMPDCIECEVSIDWIDIEPPEGFPSKQKVYYYPKNGKLVFYDKDTIYAVLYKDNCISSNVTAESINKDYQETEYEDI